MPADYTLRNRAIKQETGSNLNVWGTALNNQAIDVFDESLDGIGAVDLGSAATFDLSDGTHTKNGESDTSRRRILIFSNPNAAGTAVTIPGVQKWYLLKNTGAYPVTIAPSGGATATVVAGTDAIVFCDGTDCFVFRQRLNEFAAPNGAVDLNSQKIINVADATNPADAVNKAQVEALTAADVQLANDWADKTTGFVTGSENSAKSWAVGGTGDGDPVAGSAKEWATSTATVDGGLKGARGYAQDASSSAGSASSSAGTAGTAATNAGNSATLAQNWATSTTVVSGGLKGARGYANDAAASKASFDAIWVTSATEPSPIAAGMVWFDTAGNVLKVRDATNTVWQTVTGINAASESAAGVIEIATQAETDAGTDDARAVTPKKLQGRVGGLFSLLGNVVQAVKTDTYSTTSGSFVDVTGLEVTITPTSAASRILVFAAIEVHTITGLIIFLNLVRDSTTLSVGDAAGSRTRTSKGFGASSVASPGAVPIVELDAPATTSPVTYKIQVRANTGGAGNTVYINRASSDSADPSVGRYTSSIIAMEVL